MGKVAMSGGRAVYLVGGRELEIAMVDGKPRILCLDGSTDHNLTVIAKDAFGFKGLWMAECSRCLVHTQVPEGFGEDA